MKEKLQMVDDDQVENVGIMSGFMDEIDELLEEISGEEQEEGDDADMARMMARTRAGVARMSSRSAMVAMSWSYSSWMACASSAATTPSPT